MKKLCWSSKATESERIPSIFITRNIITRCFK